MLSTTAKQQKRKANTENKKEQQMEVVSVVWCGVVWCGVVWCGVVWCSVVWLVWCGVV